MQTRTNHGAVIDMESKPVNNLEAGLAKRLREVFDGVVNRNLHHGFRGVSRVEREAWQAVADEVVKGRCRAVNPDYVDAPSEEIRGAFVDGKFVAAVFQEESTPEEIPITPPEGYRLVAHGERIRSGDIFCNGTVWRVTGSAGDLMSPRKHAHATRVLADPDVEKAERTLKAVAEQTKKFLHVVNPGYNGLDLPAGLPPAPKTPDGYTRAVYRGEAWKSDEPAMFAVSYIGDFENWWIVDKPKPAEGAKDIHYIEFIK